MCCDFFFFFCDLYKAKRSEDPIRTKEDQEGKGREGIKRVKDPIRRSDQNKGGSEEGSRRIMKGREDQEGRRIKEGSRREGRIKRVKENGSLDDVGHHPRGIKIARASPKPPQLFQVVINTNIHTISAKKERTAPSSEAQESEDVLWKA